MIEFAERIGGLTCRYGRRMPGLQRILAVERPQSRAGPLVRVLAELFRSARPAGGVGDPAIRRSGMSAWFPYFESEIL
ncbi:hypothetical protein ACWD4P_09565 [Kitasatospora sp. NPDC002543]